MTSAVLAVCKSLLGSRRGTASSLPEQVTEAPAPEPMPAEQEMPVDSSASQVAPLDMPDQVP